MPLDVARRGTLDYKDPPLRAIVAASDVYQAGYHNGNPGGLDAIDPDLATGNIKDGVTIFGFLGTLPVGVPTKEFFVPIIKGNEILGEKGKRPAIWINAAGERGYLGFFVPQDFTSLTSFKVVLIVQATGTIDWTANSDFGANTEDYNVHTDTLTADGRAVTINEIDEVDVSAALTGIAVGDYIGLEFMIDATGGGGGVFIIGGVFKYA